MKRIWVVISILVLLVGLVPFRGVYAATYSLPVVWRTVYLNADGSLDIYDYRVYRFASGPPSDVFPYHLKTEYELYNRTLSYPVFEAYQVNGALEDRTEPTDIREDWQKIKGMLKPLPVVGSEPDFEVKVPNVKELRLLIHYRVSPDITVVGKDFARTYYALPTLGSSDVSVSDYRLSFILPQVPDCSSWPVYDEGDKKCPCFLVHRFLPKGGPIGRYYKGCDFVLFEVHGMPVQTREEIDAVYPPNILTAYSLPPVDQTFEDVKRWQEANSISPLPLIIAIVLAFFGALISYVLAVVFAALQKSAKVGYYKRKLRRVAPSMDFPSNDIYRSAFFTMDDLNMALSGYKVDYVSLLSSDSAWRVEVSPSVIKVLMEKGGNVFRAIFFSLMEKGYIVPITDGDKIVGFRLVDAKAELLPYEAKVLEAVKEAAAMDVEKKSGILERLFGGGETLAEVMNQRQPESVLLPEEFERYLKQHAETIRYGSWTYKMPKVQRLGLDILSEIARGLPPALSKTEPKDAPGSVRFWGKLAQIFGWLGTGFVLSAPLAIILLVMFEPMVALIHNATVLRAVCLMPYGVVLLMLVLGLGISGKSTGKWLHPQWWAEFVGWYRVERWIREFTRITGKEIGAYESLNWSKYYVFALLRGIEKLLERVLRTVARVKGGHDEELLRTALYAAAAETFYRNTWHSAASHAITTYTSGYHSAHKSGTSSIGSSTGSSFGGGSGGGGGSTGW